MSSVIYIDIIAASSEDEHNSDEATQKGGLYSQIAYSQSLHSLNGTPYIIKRRPLIITKPHLQNQIEAANTQTSNCHQLITSSRQTVSSDLQRPSRKQATVLQRTTSTPNLSKLTKAKVLRSTSKVDIKGMYLKKNLRGSSLKTFLNMFACPLLLFSPCSLYVVQ